MLVPVSNVMRPPFQFNKEGQNTNKKGRANNKSRKKGNAEDIFRGSWKCIKRAIKTTEKEDESSPFCVANIVSFWLEANRTCLPLPFSLKHSTTTSFKKLLSLPLASDTRSSRAEESEKENMARYKYSVRSRSSVQYINIHQVREKVERVVWPKVAKILLPFFFGLFLFFPLSLLSLGFVLRHGYGTPFRLTRTSSLPKKLCSKIRETKIKTTRKIARRTRKE